MPEGIELGYGNIIEGALAEGWVVAESVQVTPSDVEPLGTINIRARFVNQANWLPAYAVIQIRLDGVVIWEWSAVFGPSEEYTTDTITYKLPSSVSPGIHVVTALEQEQATGIPKAEFTVSTPAPPGQRNLSVTSIPQGADIYIVQALYGKAPVTVPLIYGTYEVTAVYGDKTQTRNVQVIAGTGSQQLQFTFTQEQPIDWKKWATYGAVGAATLGIIYLVTKKPETARQVYGKAIEYGKVGYEKAKEAYGRLG